MVLSAKVRHFRREKLIGWEINAAKQLTGVIRCSHTFLIRDTEIISGYQHLDIAYNLHDGEQADGGIYNARFCAGVELTTVPAADTFGDPAADVRMAGAVAQAGGKTDRLRNLYGSFRQNLAYGGLLIEIIQLVVRAEHLDIAFAAVKDHLFVEYGYSVDGDRACCRRTEYIEAYVEEEGHIDGIEPFIERNRLQIQIDCDNLDVFHADVRGIINDSLFGRGEINPQILQAVLIKGMFKLHINFLV